MDQQTQLFASQNARRSDDFRGLLGRGIMPTENIGLLENDGHLLVIKSMGKDQRLSGAQDRMFRTITEYSNNDTSPGNITVVCVWGYGRGTPRRIKVYDYTGEHEERHLSFTEWQVWIRRWWREFRTGK